MNFGFWASGEASSESAKPSAEPIADFGLKV
jgi:hypothetical protein